MGRQRYTTEQILDSTLREVEVTQTACMRKLLTILNSMVKHQSLLQVCAAPTPLHGRQLVLPGWMEDRVRCISSPTRGSVIHV